MHLGIPARYYVDPHSIFIFIRRISFNNIKIPVIEAPIGEKVELRMIPNEKTGIAKVSLWYKNKFFVIQKQKNIDLNTVHF